MAKRITFSELVRRVQSGAITEAEAEDYFAFDATQSSAGDPGIAIREGNVDISGVERIARDSAYELGIQASRVAQRNRIAELAGAPKPDGSIIAEGDSWFHLPSWYQKTMIDWLQRDYPITNIAHQGDTLAAIIAAGEYMPYLATGKVRILMFSAGGNDFLGDRLVECVNLFDPDHVDPNQAAYYLTDTFDNIIAQCDYYYRMLAHQVSSISPKTRIITHGYDHANPRCNGIFIGKPMATKGLEPCYTKLKPLCEAIVHLMIDRFNDMLKNLAGFLPNLTYVDLRGTLKPGDFFDELHPKSQKAKLTASKMARYLGPRPVRVARGRSRARAIAA